MIKKIKTIIEDSFCYVDQTGFAPVSPLTKGRILLHKLQARPTNAILTNLVKNKNPRKSEAFVLVSG